MSDSTTTTTTKPSRSTTYTAKGKSDESIQDIAQRYLPLVKSIVAKMRLHLPPSLEVEDVYSIGIYGLMSSLQNFDRSKGTAFGAYASLRIRGAILDELRRLDWMPRKLRGKAKNLQKIRNELEQTLGRLPNTSELANALELSDHETELLLESIRPITIVNLDQIFNEAEGQSGGHGHDLISDITQMDARDMAEGHEEVTRLRDALAELPEVPRKILAMYYYEHMRLAEIAVAFDLSESRICQIHGKAIADLKAILRKDD